MNRERIVFFDNSSADYGEGGRFYCNVVVLLIMLGALSMLSYWLMTETITVWKYPLRKPGYTAFITFTFILLHAPIAIGFFWILLRVYKVLRWFFIVIAFVAKSIFSLVANFSKR